jgi:hypothetical protein
MPVKEGFPPGSSSPPGYPGNTSRKTVERTSHPNAGTEAKGAKGLNSASQAFRAGLRKRAIKILGK